MNHQTKRVEDITVEDFLGNPVWEYTNDGSTNIFPIDKLPVENLDNKICGSHVEFSNGTKKWAMLGNVSSVSSKMNAHFLTISFENGGKWFHLARYHDHNYSTAGPKEFALLLGISADEIFPIKYDLSAYSNGLPAALKGMVFFDPPERLTRQELMAMAVP